MTQMFSIVLAACALGATSLVAAQDPTSLTASKADASEAAELARLIYPEALNSVIVTYTILHVVSPGYHADPNLRTLEADHPGIIDAMIAAMRPEFERGRREALPRLWTQTGAVYAAGLTPDELRQSVAFYASPTGRRLPLAERAAVASAKTGSDQVGAWANPAKDLRPDDARARSVFEASATGEKLAALQPQIDAIVNAWNSARTPEADARIGKAISKAAARFYDPTATPIRLTPLSEPKRAITSLSCKNADRITLGRDHAGETEGFAFHLQAGCCQLRQPKFIRGRQSMLFSQRNDVTAAAIPAGAS